MTKEYIAMNGKLSFEFKFDAKLDHVQRKAVSAEIVNQIREKDQANEWCNWAELKNLPKTVDGIMLEADIEEYIETRLRTLGVMNSHFQPLTVKKPSEAADQCCLVNGRWICYSLYDVYVGGLKWNFQVSVMDQHGKKSKTEVAVQIALSYEDDLTSAYFTEVASARPVETRV